MLRLLPQPKPQSAESTILKMCDRLAHSLLVEDRRAALLGLKGFSHEYRELVVSNGLRGLIDSLVNDQEDEECLKACLETLLILFGGTPRRRRVINRKYISLLRKPSSETDSIATDGGDDISMWLADEVYHNKKVLETIFQLISESDDAFIVVYALQLISAVTANRPGAARKAVLESHLGIATLVGTLSNPHDMVRNEGVLLLGSLAADHSDLQKLVAFEGAFDRVFDIIKEEGGIIYGSTAVDDCLNLLWALLQYNVSNQKLFAETGGLGRYVNILEDIGEADWPDRTGEHVANNAVTALQIGELLVVPGSEITRQHQDSLARSGVLMAVLRIAFGSLTPVPVRVASLAAAASLVAANPARQSELLSLDVPYYDLTLARTVALEPSIMPVSRALLGWALSLSSTHLFELRAAARLCLSASIHGNASTAHNFFADQITIYKDESDFLSGNLISALADYSDATRFDPYHVWFAAAVVTYAFDDSDSKAQLRSVIVGDESLGMEAHSLVQAVAGQLQTSLSMGADPVVSLAYLQLLTVWLHDDVQAAAEFTAETSVIQTLVSYVSAAGTVPSHNALVESCAAVLLGTAYLFCPKDAPFSRKQLHTLLVATPGRDQYGLQLKRLWQTTEFRDCDPSALLESPKRAKNGSPNVLLLSSFVLLVKANVSRLNNALNHDPEAAPNSKVSLELVDDLMSKVTEKTAALETAEGQLSEIQAELLETRLANSESEKKLKVAVEERDTATQKLEELTESLSAVTTERSQLAKDLEKASSSHEATSEKLGTIAKQHEKVQSELSQLKATHSKAESDLAKFSRELFQSQRSQEQAEKGLTAANKKYAQVEKERDSAVSKSQELENKLNELIKRSAVLDKDSKEAIRKADDAESKLKACLEKVDKQDSIIGSLKKEVAVLQPQLQEAKKLLSSSDSREKEKKSVIDGYKSEIDRLAKSLEEEKNRHQDEAKGSGDKISDLMRQIEVAKNELLKSQEENNKQLQNAQSQLQKLNEEVSLRDIQIKDLQNANKNKQQEGSSATDKDANKALKEELDRKQADLDELIILLDDISEQKGAYKSRLRSLGESVSESEAESEEESDCDSINEDTDQKVKGNNGSSKLVKEESSDILKETSATSDGTSAATQETPLSPGGKEEQSELPDPVIPTSDEESKHSGGSNSTAPKKTKSKKKKGKK